MGRSILYPSENMADVELASLVARIEQLENRQNVMARYATGIKRQVEKLTERFETRVELQELEGSTFITLTSVAQI
jgi:arginine decarboxylase-like protein